MSAYDAFLHPLCRPGTLDLCGARRSILSALRRELPRLTGTVLDIGCGHMPYKTLVLSPPSRATQYIGIDLPNNEYREPDLAWDGRTIPLEPASADCALATELLEHCSDPEAVLRATFRVLKPGGFLFLTVPFLWPLHSVPRDEYRFTPFSLERHLRNAGFVDVQLRALGGWEASLAQLLGLWIRRRPAGRILHSILRPAASLAAWPAVWLLERIDDPPRHFGEGCMFTGLCGTAVRPLT